MRVIFMGTPDFAAANLEAICKAGFDVVAVVSQPDKPVGRHSELKPTDVKKKAMELGIKTILQPEKASDPEFIKIIRELSPDVIVVTAYGRILKKELLQIPRFGCINVHASLLPRWRGAAPIQWAVIEGDSESGITVMQMDEGLDTGDMIAQAKLELAEDETGGSLFDRLSGLGGELICKVLRELSDNGTLPHTPQPESGSTYAKVLTKDMGNVDWNRDAESIERLARGLYPWPGTFTYYRGRMIKLIGLKPADESVFADNAAAGSVKSENGRIYVRCGSGAIEITELQPESKKRMSAADYLRGHSLDGIFTDTRD